MNESTRWARIVIIVKPDRMIHAAKICYSDQEITAFLNNSAVEGYRNIVEHSRTSEDAASRMRELFPDADSYTLDLSMKTTG